MKKTIRLGTRGSPLALIQAEEVKNRLFKNSSGLAKDLEIEIVPIHTNGDWRPDHKDLPFVEMGGNKGIFTKEIEEALLAKHIDLAVHSMKDVASSVPAGIEIAAILKRADPRDAFIGVKAKTLDELPKGSVVGTSSARRQAQLLAYRPDLRVVALRGNVETRLKKLESGAADATILAVAGLARLGLEAHISSILDPKIMLPSPGQGAIGVQARESDEDLRLFVKSIDDAISHACVSAERAVMRAIDGSCKTPAGAYAYLTPSGLLVVEALVARADGSDFIKLAATGKIEEAEQVGEVLGENLKKRSPADLFAA